MLRCTVPSNLNNDNAFEYQGEEIHTHMFKAGNWSGYKAIAIDVVTPAEAFHGDCC